ncbi:MAG TPA: hypothetical protein ENJ35_01515 [Gammaproteobacteria bacterium]|nr:hypothetical protein [Gammaproteobacteria bacterium]
MQQHFIRVCAAIVLALSFSAPVFSGGDSYRVAKLKTESAEKMRLYMAAALLLPAWPLAQQFILRAATNSNICSNKRL